MKENKLKYFVMLKCKLTHFIAVHRIFPNKKCITITESELMYVLN